ncbi:MAG: helix-turn-helix transcriptional regulator [Clostridia bacterium]|jgi:transcriptional regulator with XRE-family HTH domain|nr:helix-turn-helix transcriptional regulator [Clostridia bacterium]
MRMDKRKSNIRIGNLLKRTRKSFGYTQEEVAEMLDLAPRYISDIERDKTKGSINTLVKLCNIYKITPTYVLQEYLDIPSDFRVDPDLMGFYDLEENNRDIILQLIQYMNKKEK